MPSFKTISITKTTDLQILLEIITSDENIERKAKALKAYECNGGKQIKYTKKRLKQLYPETYSYFRTGDLSIVKKIVDKRSKAYKQAPLRYLSTPKQSDYLNEQYERYNFQKSLNEADKILNLHKYVSLWLTYVNPDKESDTLEGQYVLRALQPFNYDVFRDEITGKPIIFALPYVISDDQKKYVFYTDKEINTVIYNSKTKTIESVDLKPNPIGILPFSFVSIDTSSKYPIPSPIADQSVEWNVELSDLKTASATQGHGQLVISHPEGQKMTKYRMGKHSAITLPQSKKPDSPKTEANYISANPDLTGQLDILKFDLVSMLEEYGITPKSSSLGGSNDITSGFDRLLKEADVQDIVDENQAIFAKGTEQDIYKIFKASEIALNNKILVDDTIGIAFQKPKVLISDKETLDNIEKREKLGLILSYQKHQMLNPNLSDEQAKQLEEKIQAEREDQMKKTQSLLGGAITEQPNDKGQ